MRLKNIAKEPCGQSFHLRACEVLPEKRVRQRFFLFVPSPHAIFFFGSLQAGLGRGSGEARFLSDANVKNGMSWSNGIFRSKTAQPGVKTGISVCPHVKNTDIIDIFWCRVTGFNACEWLFMLYVRNIIGSYLYANI